jgi:hypothetical protein
MNNDALLNKLRSDHQYATDKEKRWVTLLGWLRVFAFLFWLYLIYLALGTDINRLLVTVLIGGLIFSALVIFNEYHVQILRYHQSFLELIEQYNLRKKGILQQGISNGSEHLDASHSYTYDLDIFGPSSLFEKLNFTQLPGSEKQLANYLKTIPGFEEVQARQRANQELSKRLEWIFTFQARIKGAYKKEPPDHSIEWSDSQKSQKWQFFAFGILSAITFLVMGFWIGGQLPFSIFLLNLIINGVIIFQFKKKADQEGFQITGISEQLNTYQRAFEHIHQSQFDASWLNERKQVIEKEAISAVKTLKQTLFLVDSRNNFFYAIFNSIFFLDFYLINRIHKWAGRHGEKYGDWTQTIHEIESLCSFALYYENMDGCIPELIQNHDHLLFEGTALKHPLMSPDQCVANNFTIGEESIALITGSNMSGKSTFLRTIGLTALMAWIGLPVHAESCRISVGTLFTSMRIQDDLSANTSSFYAELKRIKKLMELTKQASVPVLYLLDEILRGTNSKDRNFGAQGLIEQLKDEHAYGLISTHDLSLADQYEQEKKVKNYSFNSDIEQDKLSFDYQLSPGKCRNTNASDLMRLMGILPKDYS